jgi:uncharacterized membrane protein
MAMALSRAIGQPKAKISKRVGQLERDPGIVKRRLSEKPGGSGEAE